VRSGELCWLSVEELLNLKPFVCLFLCIDQQLNNTLEELELGLNRLTDEVAADDNFIHLGKLRKLDLSEEWFSEAGISAISLLIQVRSTFGLLFHCDPKAPLLWNICVDCYWPTFVLPG